MSKFTDNKNYDAGTSVMSVVIGPYIPSKQVLKWPNNGNYWRIVAVLAYRYCWGMPKLAQFRLSWPDSG